MGWCGAHGLFNLTKTSDLGLPYGNFHTETGSIVGKMLLECHL